MAMRKVHGIPCCERCARRAYRNDKRRLAGEKVTVWGTKKPLVKGETKEMWRKYEALREKGVSLQGAADELGISYRRVLYLRYELPIKLRRDAE